MYILPYFPIYSILLPININEQIQGGICITFNLGVVASGLVIWRFMVQVQAVEVKS
jgi:hypothetical protein